MIRLRLSASGSTTCIRYALIVIAATALGLTIVGSAGAVSVARATKTSRMVLYRTVTVDGLSIFYREAGRPDAPTLLLLHGLRSTQSGCASAGSVPLVSIAW